VTEEEPPATGFTALERFGWVGLAVLTLAIFLLALFRPTDPHAVVNRLRLAAGFDRYQAALDEGDRNFSLAMAMRRRVKEEPESREPLYELLDRAVEHFAEARDEAEGFHEDQRAQIRMAEAYHQWARMLHADATGPWYRRNDVETLERARDLVDRALALPVITGDQRRRLEELGTNIDRAITPWPVL